MYSDRVGTLTKGQKEGVVNSFGMPRLIQAGMGVNISSYYLARVTSSLGALGVVSAAGARQVIIEEVRRGNKEVIAAAYTFPGPQSYVEELLDFAYGQKKHTHPVPIDVPDPKRADYPRRLSTITAYIEVALAKSGHRGRVGCNVMWKCALTALPSIYGAMLAGVDALLCGAGVPMELPDIVARIRAGEDLEYLPLTGTGTHARLSISGDETATYLQGLYMPWLIPILSNYAFPKRMVDVWQKNYGVLPSAFVLENHAAGGHNAPPRNKVAFNEVDDLGSYFDKVVEFSTPLNIPIIVAGDFPSRGTREDYLFWRDRGAYGIQVGSRFALCRDSGMRADLRDSIIASNVAETTEVCTNDRLSPTGYPIKEVRMVGTTSDPQIVAERRKVCNRGVLLQSHFKTLPDGQEQETYICPAMPEEHYERLGGNPADTQGRVCLCNGLLATAGYYTDSEPPTVTLGESGKQVKQLIDAREVLESIMTPEWVNEQEALLQI